MTDYIPLTEEPPQRYFKTGKGLVVTLYLYGDELDPDTVSTALGVMSGQGRRKGPWQGEKTGRTYQQRTGFWRLDSGIESDDLSDHLRAIRGRLPDPDMNLMTLPGVTEGRLDILVQDPNAGPDTSPHVGFYLQPDEVLQIGRLGIAFELTCYLPVPAED